MEVSSRILKEQLLNRTTSHGYLLVSSDEDILSKESKVFIYNLFEDETSKIKFINGTNVDYLEILPENNNIKISSSREIIKFLSTSPVESKYKIVLIRNAELLRKESANALLKVLEEPPVYGKIILTTNNEEQIIKTILSRCQVINLESLNNETKNIDENLNEILLKTINRSLLELINSRDYFNEVKNEANEVYDYFYKFFHDLYIYINSKNINMLIFKENVELYKKIKVFSNENLMNILEKIVEIKSNFKINANFQLSNEELLLYIMEEQNG